MRRPIYSDSVARWKRHAEVLEPVRRVQVHRQDLAQLAPAAWQQYEVPPEWPAGRINAYYEDPASSPNAYDKVEVTLTNGTMNYNITYVDYVSLPSEMRAVGPECQPTADFDPKIGCYVPRAELLAGCPITILFDSLTRFNRAHQFLVVLIWIRSFGIGSLDRLHQPAARAIFDGLQALLPVRKGCR